jgi:hypothetical protein
MIFEALKTESDEYQPDTHQPKIEFDNKELPAGSLPLKEWGDMLSDLPADLQPKLIEVIEYVVSRGYDPFDSNFYWSPEAGYESRVIVPFKYQGRVVGNTARKVIDGKPKYLSDQHPHFVFNIDVKAVD